MLKRKKSYKLSIRYKAQSKRQLKIAQIIRVALFDCFQREGKIESCLYGTPININELNISSDLKVVNCFFIPFNTDLTIDKLLNALEDSKYVIRHYVTNHINLKYSPEINFYHDEV